LNVNFIHPTDGRELNVRVSDDLTASEAIAELIHVKFISGFAEEYELTIKGGFVLPSNQFFKDAGVVNDSRIRIMPLTDAG
jgi:hypothetical protein